MLWKESENNLISSCEIELPNQIHVFESKNLENDLRVILATQTWFDNFSILFNVSKSNKITQPTLQRFSSLLSSSWFPTVWSLKGNSLLGGKGVLPGMTILRPGQSMKSSTPAQRAWHLLANNRFPSAVQTGTKIWLHFLFSQLSHDPLDGGNPGLAQTASHKLG